MLRADALIKKIMFASKRTRVIVVAVICFTLLTASTEAKRRKKSAKAGILRQKETNVINFVRYVSTKPLGTNCLLEIF